MNKNIVKLMAIAFMGIALAACTSNAESTHDHENEAGEHKEDDKKAHSDEIIITKEHAASINLRTYLVTPTIINEVIHTSGQVISAPGDEVSIAATVSGIVSLAGKSNTVGVEVSEGTPLFYISSKNIADGDYAARTKAAYDQAKAAYERAEILVKDKIISQKEYEQARYGYQTARSAYDAIGKSSSARGTRISATMSGYLKDVLVKDGDFVNVGQPLATIAKNKTLMLKAEVSERYYASLNHIATANFKTSYDKRVYSLKDLNGRLVAYGKTTATDSYYIPVSFEFDNKGAIVPGSFVEVFLIAKPIPNAIAVPISAITEEQGAFFVYVQLDEEGFQKREVKLGVNDGLKVQVVSGLAGGERVVSNGAYEVKLASMSSVIPEGHSHNH